MRKHSSSEFEIKRRLYSTKAKMRVEEKLLQSDVKNCYVFLFVYRNIKILLYRRMISKCNKQLEV